MEKKKKISFLTLEMEGSSQPNHHIPPPPPPKAPGELAPTHPAKHHTFLVVLVLRPEGVFFPTLKNLSFFDHATSQDTRLSVHSLGMDLCCSERIEGSIELNQHQLWWSLIPSTISNKKPWMENMDFFFLFFSGFWLPMITHRQTDRQTDRWTDRLHRYIIHSYIHRWSIFKPPNLTVLC